jgi:hypothetical protein
MQQRSVFYVVVTFNSGAEDGNQPGEADADNIQQSS